MPCTSSAGKASLRNWISVIAVSCLPWSVVSAQMPDKQQKLAEIKASIEQNKQQMKAYTWTEQMTISINGQVRKQQRFQCRVGPDGKPMRTPLDAQAPQQAQGGRLRQRIVQRKKEEFEDYAEQIKALMEQYVPPSPEKLSAAFGRGDVMFSVRPGDMGQTRVVISNYVKPGDKMTLVMNQQTKQITTLSVASYLTAPSDAVNVNVTFERIPGGPNHAATEVINGTSKQLTISVQNSNYQRM